MQTITIEFSDDSAFTVRQGDRYVTQLCWDEMLGTVAELSHPKIGDCRYRMQTAEQWAAEEARRKAQFAQFAKA